jgi:hypothetical protein
VIGIHSEVWLKLAGSSPSGESLTARLAIPTVTERLLAAIDADGRRHLLVTLKPDDEELRDAQSRGVSVATRELTVRDRGTARYLDFECHDTAGHEAFDLIGGEIAEGLKSENTKPALLAARVLAKWRRFWGQSPWQILSREEQLGLFAELWFLSVWLVPRLVGGMILSGQANRWRSKPRPQLAGGCIASTDWINLRHRKMENCVSSVYGYGRKAERATRCPD